MPKPPQFKNQPLIEDGDRGAGVSWLLLAAFLGGLMVFQQGQLPKMPDIADWMEQLGGKVDEVARPVEITAQREAERLEARKAAKQADDFSITPASGRGLIQLFARSVQVQAAGDGAVISIHGIELHSVQKTGRTRFGRLGLELWRRHDGSWQRLETAERLDFEDVLPAGQNFAYQTDQSFNFTNVREPCDQQECFLRLRLMVQAADEKPDWEVSQLVPIPPPNGD